MTSPRPSTQPPARGPVSADLDWDALEIAVERNAPDTDSYLDLTTGRVVSHYLSGTQTTSSDVLRLFPRLKFFPAVAELRLSGTQVDDSIVGQRGGSFPAVKRIDVTGSQMTDGGRMKLKRAAPGAAVIP
jgi:hypothetical protein